MLRFATIGTDNTAISFLEAATRSSRLSQACSCLVMGNRRDSATAGYEALLYSQDSSRLFSGQQVEAVYIAGSVSSRFLLARRLLSEHKHVMCGKLAAAGGKTLDSLISCARRNGVSLTESLSPGYSSGILNLRTHMARLGDVRRVSFQSCRFTGHFSESTPPDSLLRDLREQCIHPIAELFGMPKKITAGAVILENGQIGGNTLLAEYSNDLTAELLYSNISGCRISNRILGEKGELRFKDLSAPRQLVFYSTQGQREPLSSVAAGHSSAEEWLSHMDGTSDWISHIRAARCAAAVMDMACGRQRASH